MFAAFCIINSLTAVTLPKHPSLYQISTRPWLYKLSQKYGRSITKLNDIPDSELKNIADQGYNILWMMGVWQLGPAGKKHDLADPGLRREFDRVLPGWTEDDVIGSPYAITWYTLNSELGVMADLQTFRRRVNSHGMLFMVDLVPNHCAIDSPLVSRFYEQFIHVIPSDRKPYDPNYYMENGIAYGRDPYSGSWTDTAQYNIWNAQMQTQLMAFLRICSQYSDGVRCDMAMLLMNKVVNQTWGYQQEKNGYRWPSAEFWKIATSTIKAEHPGFIFMAEVYWGLEREMIGLGFDYMYDKDGLYNALVGGNLDTIKGYIRNNDLAPMTHFTENHDEKRAIAEFGGVERAAAAAVVSFTLPGMKFVFEGQEEGRANLLKVHLRRAADEPVKPAVTAFYKKLLKSLNHTVFHSGTWSWVDVQSTDGSNWRLLAWKWKVGNEKRLCVINYSDQTGSGRIVLPDAKEKASGGTINITDELSGEVYNRNVEEVVSSGLVVSLGAWKSHILNY